MISSHIFPNNQQLFLNIIMNISLGYSNFISVLQKDMAISFP